MKNIVLILVAILVLGGVLMITGFAAGAQLSGVSSSLAIGTQREGVSVQDQPISEIDIAVLNANVQLVAGESYSYSISAGKHAINHQLINGKLKISQKKSRFGLDWMKFQDRGEIVVTIPTAIGLEEVSVGSASGSVQISDLTMQELEVDLFSADATILRVQAGDCDLALATGSVHLQETQLGRLDIDTAAGNVQGKALVIGGLECTLASGSVQLQGKLTGNSEISTVGGTVALRIDGKLEDYALKLGETLGSSCQLNGQPFKGSLARSNPNAFNQIQGEGVGGSIQIDFE